MSLDLRITKTSLGASFRVVHEQLVARAPRQCDCFQLVPKNNRAPFLARWCVLSIRLLLLLLGSPCS